MTATEFEREMKKRFAEAGLLPDLVAESSQFLETLDGLFVEIVSRDGAKIQQFGKIVDELNAEAGEPLTVVVRALWKIQKVGDPQPAYSVETGGPRTAELYPVDLESGHAHQQVWVEVTLLAKMVFRENGIDGDRVKAIVSEFVDEQLQMGGASYWDPIRFPQLEINGDMASFIVSRLLLTMTKRPAV